MAFSVLEQYFLNPYGLLALLGLIPLLAFYFFKPEPEERVMPSMQFFTEDQDSGSISRVFDRLMKNILLILHILAILGLAAAIADFQLPGYDKPDEAVIVLDRSASMSDSMEEAKDFVESNLGNTNTLILVDDDIEIPLEKASASEVKQYLNSVEPRDLETDIAGGLEIAQDYEGTLVLASDMDQTVSQRSVEDILASMESERSVRTMITEGANSWGVVDLDTGRDNSSVDIKNFLSSEEAIPVEINGNREEIQVGGGEVETVTFSSSHLNRIELPDDGLESDNKAYISVPREENFEVVLISDSGNPYLEKALELIDFTSVESLRPPVERDLDADVYIIGETGRMLRETASEINSQVENGASLIVFAQRGLENLEMDSIPYSIGKRENRTVEIEEPVRINIGQTQVHRLEEVNGETLSDPGSTLIKSKHGKGDVLLYNIRDEDFRFDFLYPIFWKNILEDLTDRPSLQEMNTLTGETIVSSTVETPSGENKGDEVRMTDAGFYNTSEAVYAANLLSEEESKPSQVEIDTGSGSDQDSSKSLQNLVVLLLASLIVADLAYLRYTGDIK